MLVGVLRALRTRHAIYQAFAWRIAVGVLIALHVCEYGDWDVIGQLSKTLIGKIPTKHLGLNEMVLDWSHFQASHWF